MGQTVHAVVGGGTANKKIVYQGLKEVLNDGDVVGVVWDPEHTSTTEDIFDYILDNEVPFVMYYKDGANPHKLFRESTHGVVQKVRNPYSSVLKAVEGGGAILFNWADSENPQDDPDESLISHVFETLGEDTLVLELTNGLAPIVANPPVPIPEPEEVQEDEDETEPEQNDLDDFTKEELESMPAAQVKSWGAKRGLVSTTKGGIIAEVFPPDVEEEEEEEEAEPTTDDLEPAPSVGRAPENDTEVGKALRQASAWLLKAANLLGE